MVLPRIIVNLSKNLLSMKTQYLLKLILFLLVSQTLFSQERKTYCNPINIDYGYTPIPNFSSQGRHRATADPVITLYKNKYYLFSTNQWGYWVSDNLQTWKFLSRKFLQPYNKVYDELCAPALFVKDDTLMVIGSTYTKEFTVWASVFPEKNEWFEKVHAQESGAWDPAIFQDEDKRVYLYHGSSNLYPLYGEELDRYTLQPISPKKELIHLNDSLHGWERFGENQDNTFLKPFLEGAWMNKYQGKYYLQYGAPGTEFSHYADGVYTSENPLGPFTYQSHNPFAYKPGGFARGAGHGASFQDNFGNWWHVSTITIASKNSFERRLGLWPSYFDQDGILYSNTLFGDYPHYIPDSQEKNPKKLFTGWMLLNFQKPVEVSSFITAYPPNNAVNESMRTYWSAKTGNKGEYIISDLGEISTVHAIQINYADQDLDSSFLGKFNNIYHQYKLYSSNDKKTWKLIVDKSMNKTDIPHDYVELHKPIQARYLKLENIHMPTGKFALSGFRIFGKGHGLPPKKVREFVVLRGEHEKRNAWLKWARESSATGYIIYAGIHPEKLYTTIMVYDQNDYYFNSMDIDKTYYFKIAPFNENGLGEESEIFKVE